MANFVGEKKKEQRCPWKGRTTRKAKKRQLWAGGRFQGLERPQASRRGRKAAARGLVGEPGQEGREGGRSA